MVERISTVNLLFAGSDHGLSQPRPVSESAPPGPGWAERATNSDSNIAIFFQAMIALLFYLLSGIRGGIRSSPAMEAPLGLLPSHCPGRPEQKTCELICASKTKTQNTPHVPPDQQTFLLWLLHIEH